MKIYVSRRDENVTAKLDEAYTNEQTVMLEYLKGEKAGKTISITHSTFKRWWKAVDVEEDIAEVEMEQKNELDIEAQEINPEDVKVVEPNLVPMPGIEKLEELKKEYSPKENIFDYVISLLTVDYKLSTNGKKITLLCNSKPFATIYKRKNSIRLYCAKEVIENLGQLVHNIDKGEKLNQLSAYVDYNNINTVLSKIS